MRKLAILVLVAVAGLATAAVALGGGSDSTAEPAAKKARKNIVKTAASDGRFDTLVSLVKSAGLAKTLSGKGPFTVFAPTDKAFKKVPAETLESLGEMRGAQARAPLPRRGRPLPGRAGGQGRLAQRRGRASRSRPHAEAPCESVARR